MWLLNIVGDYKFIGFPQQTKVYSKQEILDAIERMNGLKDVMISLCSFLDGKPILQGIVYDIDTMNIEDAIKLYNFYEDYTSMLVFSGSKGFHVHVKTVPMIVSRQSLKKYQGTVIRELNIKSVDSHLLGSINHLIRVPGTVNMKSGREAFIIDRREGKDLIIPLLDEKEIHEPPLQTGPNKPPRHVYPCLEIGIKDKEPQHLLRFLYVIYKLSLGFPYEDICKLVHNIGKEYWVDYDFDKTQYQLDHIIRGPYRNNISCKVLKDLGFCTKCGFYDFFG